MADRKRILIADDDPDLLELLQTYLTHQGYDVIAAANGKDALNLALTETVDLIMLDVMMPYIDGYHVAYEVSNKLGDKAPRIVIVTSRNTSREQGIALMSGAYEIIQKPFDMNQLSTRVAQIIAGSSGAAK
ncbi:MAG: response regulator transcription factor [Elusimicrobia bacterium]|nr:response regulator transcription factor [Elusimicrobiota bacterium]MDE2314324.1 response regulator transcription factor [Elusimicrobiota bacterium]